MHSASGALRLGLITSLDCKCSVLRKVCKRMLSAGGQSPYPNRNVAGLLPSMSMKAALNDLGTPIVQCGVAVHSNLVLTIKLGTDV